VVHKYNIAICPPVEVVAEVKRLKLLLKERIGWYSSSNAEAHVTFDVFECDDWLIKNWYTLLHQFSGIQESQTVQFNFISAFQSSHTVFIAPSEESELYIKQLFAGYRQVVGDKGQLTEISPHITIGKGLRQQQFEQAVELLKTQQVSLSFVCDNIALRRFDEQRKQYEVLDRFYFENNIA
jgi:2'-5' RNA ligase